IGNLLTNAIKFTEPRGHISVRAERQGGEAALTVSDDGMGMPAELVPRVFDLFLQGQRTLARSEGGLGMGLTIVRSLVELHGGRVEASSAGPGLGSTFTVRLPLVAAAEQAAARAGDPETGAPAAAGPGRRILVVDDNVDAAETLADALRQSGHDVRVAHDGPG